MKEIGRYGRWEDSSCVCVCVWVCACVCVCFTFIVRPEKEILSLGDKGINDTRGEEAMGLFYMQLSLLKGAK